MGSITTACGSGSTVDMTY